MQCLLQALLWCWWGTLMPCGASLDFGSSKDPSGRNMIIIQAFAFEAIFLHLGGQRPALFMHMCVCKCCWQMPSEMSSANRGNRLSKAPPQEQANSEISLPSWQGFAKCAIMYLCFPDPEKYQSIINVGFFDWEMLVVRLGVLCRLC